MLPELDMQRLLLALHLLGFAIGVGGATVTDVFFFKFLRDYKISKSEADFMQTLSRIMWVGVLILALSGLGLFLHDPARLLASAKFISKMTVVAVLVANGAFLHFSVSPRLHNIAYMPANHPKRGEFRRFRERAFISGGISLVSWYYAFALAVSRLHDIPIAVYLGIYTVLLIVAFAGALLSDWALTRKAERATSGSR